MAPVLVESSDNHAVVHDPVNSDWMSLVGAIDGERFDILARRYYLALHHFRRQRARPPLPGLVEILAQDKRIRPLNNGLQGQVVCAGVYISSLRDVGRDGLVAVCLCWPPHIACIGGRTEGGRADAGM